MTTIRGWLFDLDGTLLDSAPDLVGALNWLRLEKGLEPLPLDQMSQYVSRGAQGLLEAGMPRASDGEFAAWKRAFLQRYAETLTDHSRLYPGIDALLYRLEQAGIPWGIVTNKMESLTWPILKALGLDSRAASVVCGDTLEHSKPHPAPVLHACAALQVEPQQVVFAGDDVRDIQAAHAAGTQAAAALYGYGSAELQRQELPVTYQIQQVSDYLSLAF